MIDATGLVVSPGFIDMLGQSETSLLIDNRSLSKLSQGITSEITGEGGSIAPQNAIRKITSLPAQREHLVNRGLLKEGFFADITIFDPATIIDKATYAQPAQLSEGVKYVLVNGQVEFENGKLTGVQAGRALKNRE